MFKLHETYKTEAGEDARLIWKADDGRLLWLRKTRNDKFDAYWTSASGVIRNDIERKGIATDETEGMFV